MDQELESFVNLLNKNRAPRPVTSELAHLPSWAQRALSKNPPPLPPRKTLPPVNGAASDAKPEPKLTSEIVVEPPVLSTPPAAPAPMADVIETVPAPSIVSPAVDPPLAEIDPPVVAIVPTEPSVADTPVVAVAAADISPPAMKAATKAFPPARKPATNEQAIDRIDLAPATRAEIGSVPALADMFSGPVSLEPSAINKDDAAPIAFAAIEELPDGPDVTEAGETAPAAESPKDAPLVFPLVLKEPPPHADIVPLPVRRRRPLAYIAAAAAVIAVVAVVSGSYWYANQHRQLLASLGVMPATKPPTSPKAIAKSDPSPAPARRSPPDGISASGSAAIAPVADAMPNVTLTAAPAEPPKAEKIVVAADPPPPPPPKPVQVAKIDMKATDTPPASAQAVQAAAPQTAAKVSPTTAPSKATVANEPAKVIAIKEPPKPAIAPPKEAAESPKEAPLAKPAAAAPVLAATPAKGPERSAMAKTDKVGTDKPAAENEMAPKQVAMLTANTTVPATSAAPPSAKPAAPPAPARSASSGDQPTWVRNALPTPAFTGRPQIAIVIDDLGLDRSRTERAIALAGPVTLSFLAYASELPQQTEAARRAGHELIVHIPMEPIARPKLVSSTSGGDAVHDELLRRLRWDLSRFSGYVGVNNHMGNRLAADPESAQTVIGELKARGLLFLDTRGVAGGVIAVAQRLGVPTVSRDIFLDDDVSAAAINERLAALEKLARERGTAIAIGRPHDQTLAALDLWLAGLASKGLQLVPLTAIVRDREQHVAGAN